MSLKSQQTMGKTPQNHTTGIRRIIFTVTEIDDVPRLQKLGAKLVGKMVQYDNTYRLCYLRGPEGILIALAKNLNGASK